MPPRKTVCLQSVLSLEADGTIMKHDITGIKAAVTGAADARFSNPLESFALRRKIYPNKKRNNL